MMPAVMPSVRDLFDRLNSLSGRTQSCRCCECRCLGLVRNQRPCREQGRRWDGKTNLTHRVLLLVVAPPSGLRHTTPCA